MSDVTRIEEGDGKNMLAMQEGQTCYDVNLSTGLFMFFPGQKQESYVQIALAPVPVEGGRSFPASDAVIVTCGLLI